MQEKHLLLSAAKMPFIIRNKLQLNHRLPGFKIRHNTHYQIRIYAYASSELAEGHIIPISRKERIDLKEKFFLFLRSMRSLRFNQLRLINHLPGVD
jgi:hypothetical protein